MTGTITGNIASKAGVELVRKDTENLRNVMDARFDAMDSRLERFVATESGVTSIRSDLMWKLGGLRISLTAIEVRVL